MEAILQRIASSGLNIPHLLITGGSLLAALLLIGILGRIIFSGGTTLSRSLSSSIAIFYIYAVAVVLFVFQTPLKAYVAPLPFVSLQADTMIFFSFTTSQFPAICTELVNMILLAFLVNLADQWMPRGKNVFTWLLFRILTVVISMGLHLLATGLLSYFVPQGIMEYSAVILLCVLLLMLVTGALRLLVGLALTAVNPIIAGLYTFFFANIIGRQVTKAVLTTAILSGTLVILEHFGITALSIAAAGLIAYLPLLILLLIVWYLVGKFL